MPPRHAYWTIILDDQPTAFRAHEAEELLPTLNRLKEKHASAVMKWFERGKLFESRDAAKDAGGGAGERRWEGPRPDRDDRGGAEDARAPRPRSTSPAKDKNWRPGGDHKDPRQKYKDASKAKWDRFKQNIRDRSERGRAAAAAGDAPPADNAADNAQEHEIDGLDPETLLSGATDPETFSPPHGDPLREHIDEDADHDDDGDDDSDDDGDDEGNDESDDSDEASNVHGSEDTGRAERQSPDDDDDDSELEDGAPSRPHGDAVVHPPRRSQDDRGERPRPPRRDEGESRGERPGGGYQGKKPWTDRPPRRDGERPGGGYQGNRPWGADRDRQGGSRPPGGSARATPDGAESRGYQGSKPWNDRPPRRDDEQGGPPREGGERGGGGYQGNRPWSDRPPRRDDDRGGSRSESGSGYQNRERPSGGGYQGNRPWSDRPPRRDDERGGPPRGDRPSGGGYQGSRPWGGGGDRDRTGPPREGGWRPQGPPSGDRPYGDRPPRRDDNRGGYQNRERPGGTSRGSSGGGESRGGYQNRERPSGGGSSRPSGGSGESRGYQGNRPWGGGGGDRGRGGQGGPPREGGWRPQGPPRDRPPGDYPPRRDDDRGGSGGRPGYEGRKPWGAGGGSGAPDRERKTWTPKPGGGKPWGAGPGNRPPAGGRKPWGSERGDAPREPRKPSDDE
ncbi:MAG TPA: hypothetical protein VNJ02_04730 [Vicinamibacterales bacterium]|nr:hypothetical protein [Vicinamibacterales bacterium]